MQDYYAVLELSATCTEQEIRKKYRQLALRYHPDHNAGDTAAEMRFKEIAEAYRVLSDKKKRREFDLLYRKKAKASTSTRRTASSTASSGRTTTAKAAPLPPFMQRLFSALKQHPLKKVSSKLTRKGVLFFQHYRQQVDSYALSIHNNAKKTVQRWRDELRRGIHLRRRSFRRGAGQRTCHQRQNQTRSFFERKQQQRHQEKKGPMEYRSGELDIVYTTSLSTRELKKGKKITVRVPAASGQKRDEFLEITIPAQSRDGQRLRIRGKGHHSTSGSKRGDLYLHLVQE